MKLILVLALAVCCNAAPYFNDKDSTELSRPSPINPDIPGDPKPEETITLIGEDTKVKRDTNEDEEPTADADQPVEFRKVCDSNHKNEDDDHELSKRAFPEPLPASGAPPATESEEKGSEPRLLTKREDEAADVSCEDHHHHQVQNLPDSDPTDDHSHHKRDAVNSKEDTTPDPDGPTDPALEPNEYSQ